MYSNLLLFIQKRNKKIYYSKSNMQHRKQGLNGQVGEWGSADPSW